MKLYLKVSVLFCAFFFNFLVYGQYGNTAIDKGLNAINENVLKSQIQFLASDWTEGRELGTKGAYLAGDYIASIFQLHGLKPAGDYQNTKPSRRQKLLGEKAVVGTSYFQNFSVIKEKASPTFKMNLVTNHKNFSKKTPFTYKSDFDVISNLSSINFSSQVVFVGYGIYDEKLKINDYKNKKLKGKIILRIKGYPGQHDSLSNSYKKFHKTSLTNLESQKDAYVKKMSVLGILEVNTKKDISLDWAKSPFRQNLPMYEGDKKIVWAYDTKYAYMDDTYSDAISLIRIIPSVANKILENINITVASFEKSAAISYKYSTQELSNISVEFKKEVETELIQVRNVLGLIEGEDPNDVVVVGAHYDHLGKYNGYIWNGSDDNASGTVGIMSIAKACIATGLKPKRTIIFAAWTGEERGLFGSRKFVDTYPNEKIHVVLNYDMISRNDYSDKEGNKCSMIYTKAFPAIEKTTKKNNSEYKLGLKINYAPMDKPIGGSDNGSFAKKDIPVFWLFIGNHIDYHRPSDHFEKANWKKFTSIVKLGFLNVWKFANTEKGILSYE